MGLGAGRWWRELTPRRAVMAAIVVATVMRLWCTAGVPLTICNDGVGYLANARQLLAMEDVEWHPARTPGYPAFLAGVFALCGTGPVAVLLAQHALGVLSVGLIAGIAARLAGARWGLALGALTAVDPVMLGLESYVLSETLATALLVLCAAVIVLGTGRWWGFGLGLAIGALCMVRPAFQLIAPVLGLAWVMGCVGARPRMVAALLVAAGFFGVTGAWLARNWRQGVVGMSSSNATVAWVGVCEAGLLSDDFPLPDNVRLEYERSVKPAPHDDEIALQFVVWMNAWRSVESRQLLKRWVLHSVGSAPGAYAAMAVRAVGWQLEVFPEWGQTRHDELRWLMRRLSQDGLKLKQRQPNISVSGQPEGLEQFVMPAGRGPMARYLRWWSNRWWVGLPRLALFGCAIAAALVAGWRRQWGVSLLFLGTLAYLGAHAALLLAPSRYSAPCWAVWTIAPAAVWGMWRNFSTRSVEVPNQAASRSSSGNRGGAE